MPHQYPALMSQLEPSAFLFPSHGCLGECPILQQAATRWVLRAASPPSPALTTYSSRPLKDQRWFVPGWGKDLVGDDSQVCSHFISHTSSSTILFPCLSGRTGHRMDAQEALENHLWITCGVCGMRKRFRRLSDTFEVKQKNVCFVRYQKLSPCPWYLLDQRSPTFLAPGTSFMEDNFFRTQDR